MNARLRRLLAVLSAAGVVGEIARSGLITARWDTLHAHVLVVLVTLMLYAPAGALKLSVERRDLVIHCRQLRLAVCTVDVDVMHAITCVCDVPLISE
jgi:hypothetical protein